MVRVMCKITEIAQGEISEAKNGKSRKIGETLYGFPHANQKVKEHSLPTKNPEGVR